MNERIEWYWDLMWDEGGEQIFHGTCLAIRGHKLEMSFQWGEPSFKIICPEDGCIRVSEDLPKGEDAWKFEGECWLDEWWGQVGIELLVESDVTVLLPIKDAKAIPSEDGPSIEVTPFRVMLEKTPCSHSATESFHGKRTCLLCADVLA